MKSESNDLATRCPCCGAIVTDPAIANGIRINRRATLGAEIVQTEQRLGAIPKDGKHETERWMVGVRLDTLRNQLARMEATNAD